MTNKLWIKEDTLVVRPWEIVAMHVERFDATMWDFVLYLRGGNVLIWPKKFDSQEKAQQKMEGIMELIDGTK